MHKSITYVIGKILEPLPSILKYLKYLKVQNRTQLIWPMRFRWMWSHVAFSGYRLKNMKSKEFCTINPFSVSAKLKKCWLQYFPSHMQQPSVHCNAELSWHLCTFRFDYGFGRGDVICLGLFGYLFYDCLPYKWPSLPFSPGLKYGSQHILVLLICVNCL